MAFDQPTRNRLQKFVSDSRDLLVKEFTHQLQNEFGLDPASGSVTPLENLHHLDDSQRETARILRETLSHYNATTPYSGNSESLQRIVREQAFTVLNRLAALRMAEARDLLIESVALGYKSKGFRLYARLAGAGLGESGDAYRSYLFGVFDEFAFDLAVLFDRFSPNGRMFPHETAMLGLLESINDPEIESLWAEDETIGWIYQYFNSKEERKKMRDASTAPRNSRELAVRNQFFTPRYVVEFLTDNTLGRIWYEMTNGETLLQNQCRYLVRRPNEIFLKPGKSITDQPQQENLSQEQILQQPVHIPHRPLKDPRDIRMLDPACGSMHFGLYAFDLFEVIYSESWEIAHGSDEAQKSSVLFATFVSFVARYADKATFLRDVPRLIIEHNVHGIDIDPRAVQIAGLSLWLRAQRCWQQQGLRPQNRPRIRRSNIICAEPMPGEEPFLNEFVDSFLSIVPERKLLGQLVRRVFDAMKLAGEAGALLKIEEEIIGEVSQAKQQWMAAPKVEQGRLFAGEVPVQEELGFDVSGVTDETFWERAEERIYAALKAYAEHSEKDDGYQRRLFADDAARGFAFIDICRQRYDVVLMNPPFGETSKLSKAYIVSAFPLTKNDVYATFIERGLKLLDRNAFIGVIASRTGFFLSSFSSFREWLLSNQRLALIADLGNGVLDAAMVNTAAFTIENRYDPNTQAVVFNLLEAEDKGRLLLNLICERLDQANFILPVFFRLLPGSPFAYWVSPSVLAIPKNTKRFEADGREVRQGLATSDDFRFVRAQWEVSSEAVGAHAIWMPFAKGGESAAFYSDIHLLILWHNDGLEMKRFAADRWGSASRTIKSVDRYFESGLTYTSYTLLGFSPRVLPAGCVFSVAGMHIFLPNNDPWYCLGFLTSSFVRYFLSLITDGRKFEAGYVKSIPFLNEAQAGNEGLEIVRLTRACYDALRQRDARNETSHLFYLPPFVENSHKVNRNDGDLATARHSIDRSVLNLFGLTEREISANSPGLNGDSMVELDAEALLGLSEAVDSQDLRLVQTRDLLSWIVGAVWGRWDIQFGTGEKSVPKLPDPFAPLPVCPPGQLQNTQGLPITKEEVERLNDEGSWNYPIQIPWEGIIVDDPGHRLDIETRAHQVLEAISKDHLKDFERDACEILGVRTLRDYFRKPASFFADHLRRYSKSRRQAPIYWPLSTRSGSYTIWIYYHRLTNQTLFTCINEYVDPKLRDIRDTLSKLRSKGTGRSSIEEKELERLHEFELELQEFRDELLRLAELQWSPNLNDGVQITAAPLWKLFRLSKWQKTLKETWESLDRGDHDWAHLAYTLWPDRVREKCKTDKSLAIAHGLEQLYVEPPLAAKKNRKGKPAMEEVLEMEEE